jgi:iron(III) transport system permease protein
LGPVAFHDELAPILEALAKRSVPCALWNSRERARLSAVLSLLAGVAVALILWLTNVRGKGAFAFLFLIPMMILLYVTVTAWIQALGPSSPLLHTLGLAPPLGTTHPLY